MTGMNLFIVQAVAKSSFFLPNPHLHPLLFMKSTLLPRILAGLCLVIAGNSLRAQTMQQGEWAGFNVRHWNTTRELSPELQTALRNQEPWQNFESAHGAWYVEFDEISGLPHRASGPAFAVAGSSSEEKAMNLLSRELDGYRMPLEDLTLRSSHAQGKFHYVDFDQTYRGLTVIGSRATVRLTLDGRVVLFGTDLYPEISVITVPAIGPETAAAASATGIPYAVTSSSVDPKLAILPLPGPDGLEYRLVYRVESHFEPVNGIPGYFKSLVDARSGELLSRSSRVHDCSHFLAADASVEGTVFDNPLIAGEVRGLPYLRVQVSGVDYYTDANGSVNIPTITTPTMATVYMDGLYAEVQEGAAETTPSEFTTMLNPGLNTISFDPEASSREISAYYHTNIVHDFMKGFFPAFTTLDFPFLVRVDRTDGSCNAFYDGSSINFYAPGGGCPATALFSDVVYHEYGHGLNYDVYSFFGDGSGMGNGAMQEGYADIWGLSITGNPILGDGFAGAGTDVRRYDIDPKVYPEDLVGEVHADGEIIAGAWWDFGVIRGSLEEMTDLWIATFPATIDGADGNEGAIYSEVLLEALVQDDDDADLSNGTPRDVDIIAAFGQHGITLLASAELNHTPSSALADEPILIEANLDVDFPAYLGDVSVLWRPQGTSTWTKENLGEVSDGEFSVELPAQPAGTILEYYFEVSDIYGAKALAEPSKADQPADPNLPFFVLVGYALKGTEDFDNFSGAWLDDPFGTDDAATGRWEINIPQVSSTSGFVNQPGVDRTPDNTLNFCQVTGYQGYTSSSPANFDIDGGETSIRSPEFNAGIYDDPVFSFYRWFSNDPPGGANPGNDPFEVFISNNGTTWIPVSTTKTSDASWRQDVIRISDYVSANTTVSLLFIASDRFIAGLPFDGGSLVEALVDDLQIYGIGEEEEPVSGIDQPTGYGAISVFPNPASAGFQIGLPGQLGADYVELINTAGQRVWTSRPSSGASVLQVPDPGFAEGLYTVRVRAGDRWLSRRVVIQH